MVINLYAILDLVSGDCMDRRKFVLNNIILCCESIPKNMNSIVIYCHGFGENKDRIKQHYEILNSNNIGIISFDFPCHGDDKQDDIQFNLTNSIDYLNAVIKYVKKYDVPFCLMGSSFGGYIILSRINRVSEKIDKVFLKFPAVNFYECTKRKLKIDLNYFDEHEYYEFLNGRRLYKEGFIQFMNDNLMNKFDKHNSNIYIIHGDKDNTVLLKDVWYFCKKNNINLKVIEGAKHGMKDHLDIVNIELVNYLKK